MFIRIHSPEKKRGIGLVELMIVIAILGVITIFSLPTISKLHKASESAQARANARNLESMSASLAALGMAHVIPGSLGGVEATARLIRTGVTVSEGPMAGSHFMMESLSDDDITEMSKYLRVAYGKYELRLEYYDAGVTLKWVSYDYSSLATLGPCRIEKTRVA